MGWILYCLDDVVTDCEVYYRRDIRKMPGADALRLVYRLWNYVEFDMEGRPRSSAARFLERARQTAVESTPSDLDDLQEIEDIEVAYVGVA